MSRNPYADLAPTAFWKTGVAQAHPLAPSALYRKSFEISATDRVCTAGSCFAQHIARAMRGSGFNVLDLEPAPAGLARSAQQKFGYGLYSARYANIYTSRQLLQLLREAFEQAPSPDPVWEKDGRFYDSMRPSVEPQGLDSPEEVMTHRAAHLEKVRDLFQSLDVFIFTLGLTETWRLSGTDWVFPTAPGTIAGDYDPSVYEFVNLTHSEVLGDMQQAIDLIRAHNTSANLRFLFTVSPVPLTATYSPDHVLVATSYSKSVLRSVVGEICGSVSPSAYFPSYEMVTAPWSRGIYYDANLRSVNPAGVEIIMNSFLGHHAPAPHAPQGDESGAPGQALAAHTEEVACEEALLDVFAK